MEAEGMARRSKHEYLRVMWQRSQRARRAERSALLDDVTRVCRYQRKYAIGALSRAALPSAAGAPGGPAAAHLSRAGDSALRAILGGLGLLVHQRLKAALPQWLL